MVQLQGLGPQYNVVLVVKFMFSHGAGELQNIPIDNTYILGNNNINKNRTLNINSVSSLQVGIVCNSRSILFNAGALLSLYRFLALHDWFWRVTLPGGPSSSITDCYDLICHILEYSLMSCNLSWHDHASQRLSCSRVISYKALCSHSGHHLRYDIIKQLLQLRYLATGMFG